MDRHRRRRERPAGNVSPAHRRARLDRAPHAAARLRALGAGGVHPRRGTGRARPRRHPVRHRRLAHRGAPARRGPARLRGGPRRRRPRYDVKVYEGLHNAAAFERADEFDVLSNQFDFLPLTYSRLVSTPVVTTIHGFSSERIVPVYRAYDDIGHYVAISDADRHPDLTYDATIHHGIDLSPFTFRDRTRRLPAVPRPHPSRQGHPPGGRGRPPGRVCRWSSPGSCRTRTTSGSSSNRTSERPASATWARSGRPSGTRCWAARWRCCTSSASPSRSGCRSSSRWPPGRR